jgi:hypothetical protein
MGSTTTEIFSVRRHVAHSKVRSSNPRSPGETRVNAILCLQVGHIGLSLNEVPIHVCAHAAPVKQILPPFEPEAHDLAGQGGLSEAVQSPTGPLAGATW